MAQVAPATEVTGFAAAGSAVAPPMPRLHSFSLAWMDTLVHAQVWLLDASVFVWAGVGSAASGGCRLPCLALAMQSPLASAPSSSLLLGSMDASSGADSEDSESEATLGMAARMAKAIGVPVAISLSLQGADTAGAGGMGMGMGGGGGEGVGAAGMEGAAPTAPSDGGPELRVFVERAILKELKTCQRLGMLAKPAPTVQ